MKRFTHGCPRGAQLSYSTMVFYRTVDKLNVIHGVVGTPLIDKLNVIHGVIGTSHQCRCRRPLIDKLYGTHGGTNDALAPPRTPGWLRDRKGVTSPLGDVGLWGGV
jgi:hypothetical protein